MQTKPSPPRNIAQTRGKSLLQNIKSKVARAILCLPILSSKEDEPRKGKEEIPTGWVPLNQIERERLLESMGVSGARVKGGVEVGKMR